MPIKKANTPNQCLPALYAGLSNFFDSGDKLAASLPQNHEVLPVYSFGLDKFADEPQKTLRGLQPVGWRFIGTGPASSLGCHVSMKRVRLTGAASNQDIANLLNWFHQAVDQASQRLGKQAYEVRALRIPGLLIEAFWVYCPNSDNDYLVPIAGSLSGSIPSSAPHAPRPRNQADREPINWDLKPMQPLSVEEFFQKVGKAAQYKLKKDEELHPPANVGGRA